MSARGIFSVWAPAERLGCGVIVLTALLVAGCGQKGALIAARPAAQPSSAAARAPLPPPEPLEPPFPGTAPR